MRLVLLFAVFITFGCTTATEPNSARKLGAIAGYQSGDPPVAIEVNGRTATVTFTTYGNSCYTSAATEVRLIGLAAIVTPYDNDPGCLDRMLKHIEHRAVIRFAEPGAARILIRGIDVSTRTAQDMVGDTITIQRTVDVR